jgi:hypothetical protein
VCAAHVCVECGRDAVAPLTGHRVPEARAVFGPAGVDYFVQPWARTPQHGAVRRSAVALPSCVVLSLLHTNLCARVCVCRYASAFHYLSASINLKPDFPTSYMYLAITLRCVNFSVLCASRLALRPLPCLPVCALTAVA